MAKQHRTVKVHTKKLQKILGCKEFNVNEIFKYMEEE